MAETAGELGCKNIEREILAFARGLELMKDHIDTKMGELQKALKTIEGYEGGDINVVAAVCELRRHQMRRGERKCHTDRNTRANTQDAESW